MPTLLAPFSESQVDSLNAYQESGVFHPFTCAHRGDGQHPDGEGILVARKEGWVCPVCGYTQNWCHQFMADWTWKGK